jgi:uncharacterized protein YchJ
MRPTHPNNPSRRTLFITLALSLGTLTTGCATLQTPEESLQQRAQSFWDARKANDDLSAYKYEAASQTGEPSLQNYLKGRAGIEYRSIEIKSVRLLTPTEGEVNLVTSYSIPSIGFNKPIAGNMTDTWVKIDGQWYHTNPAKTKPSSTASDAPSK